MKLFLDTANLQEIKEAVSWGIIEGVTTNPSLIKKAVLELKKSHEDTNMDNYIKKILATAGRMCPVSLEVPGLDADDMVNQGMYLYEKFDQVTGNVVIKIPVCTMNSKGEGNLFDGIMAIRRLTDERIPVNATLIFTPEQALLAAKAGAEYVSPFAGRIDDRIRRAAGVSFDKSEYFPAEGISDTENPDMIITDQGLLSGVDLVSRIADIFIEYEIECEIIAASIRNAIQAREMAEVGAHIATIPFSVLK
ncbi:MAG: transaldolase family protein, partial [Eubacteriales bacterium]|nr:transaldolase family protein [Eubacteriales bacterium]